jgi:hypothetical protein
LDLFCFGFFGVFIPKGENVGPNPAKWFQSRKRQAMSEHRKRRSKREKFDLGGVWMMVSIQESEVVLILSIFANLCLLCLFCHKSPKRGRL